MNYFYARVSTDGQNVARQLDAAKRVGIDDKNVFVDKESGKDFDRTNWKRLTKKLKKGDVLFVKSIDRIGRNYKEIIRVWQELTKDREIDVVVLDMPLLDTRKEKNLLGTFVADIVLQILSFVAENERVNILERQRQGIDAAKARGVQFGRKRHPVPKGFKAMAIRYLKGEISGPEGARQLGMAQTTFIRNAKRFGEKKKIWRAPSRLLPFGFDDGEKFDFYAEKWFDGEISELCAATELGLGRDTFSRYAHKRFPSRKSKYRARGARFDDVVSDERFRRIALAWREGKTTLKIAAAQFGMGRNRFNYLAKQAFPDVERPRKGCYYLPNPLNFEEIVRRWIDGEISQKEAARLCGFCKATFSVRAKEFY